MFEVLAYLYEHYWRPDACPESEQLTKKLTAVGFEPEEISQALDWLQGLRSVSEQTIVSPQSSSTRVFIDAELELLGVEALGFLQFLNAAGVLSAGVRETLLDRVLAVPQGPVSLDDFKLLVLLVFWSFGEEPDALILDELYAEEGLRNIH